MKIFICFIGFLCCLNSFGQNCDAPLHPDVLDSLTTQNYDWKKLQFQSVIGSEEYRLRFKKIAATSWEYRMMHMDTSKAFGFDLNETYVWNAKAWCDTASNTTSPWSAQDTFTTNSFIPISFSPTFDISLSHLICDSLADLLFLIAQDPNEPDIATSAVFSNSGTFAINTLNAGDVIGVADVMAGGGFYEFDYTLIVDQIISTNEAVIAMKNDSTGVIDGSFTIENDNGGIKIINSIPSDGNFYTAGNSSELLFYNLFLNPDPGALEFYTSIESELSDNYIQSIDYIISCIDLVEEWQNLFCYPNPTNKILNFYQKGDLMLFNSRGQLILQTNAEYYLDVSMLERGMYFVLLQTETDLFKTKLMLR